MNTPSTCRVLLARTRARPAALAVVVASAAAGGCGSSAPNVERSGWLDGSPGVADRAFAATGATRLEKGVAAAPALALGSTGEASGGRPDSIRVAAQSGPLRAGSVDDNAKFADFLEYRTKFLAKKIEAHDVDVAGRVLVRVRNAAGAPVLGADVALGSSGGAVVAAARTDIRGQAVLFPPVPAVDQQQGAQTLTLTAEHGGVRTSGSVNGRAATELTLATQAAAPAHLDVLFLVDTTGSMGDEIERLRESMASVAERIAALPSAPDVRFGLTAFRDRGDAYVTRTFNFTGDVGEIQKALREVEAGGGGDTPESVNAGLHDGLTKPTWRDGADTVRLVFLIGDAAPHLDYKDDADYVAEARDAAKRGITILPIASSGLDEQGEYVFRQIALLSGGRFNFLTYGAGGDAPGDRTTHNVTGYEALSLDELVVKLVKDETEVTAPKAP